MTDPRDVVTLAPVDDVVLARLVEAAVSRASADEVTPPLTPGPGWSAQRVGWLRSFHRDRRAGLDGPAAEATWAVLLDEQTVGSIRLKRTDREGVLEVGVWLTWDARGRGVGTAALAAALERAQDSGASAVCADTTAGNAGATGALRRLGFTLHPGRGQAVHAVAAIERAGPARGHR